MNSKGPVMGEDWSVAVKAKEFWKALLCGGGQASEMVGKQGVGVAPSFAWNLKRV
ncbi:hypothetical protein DSLASN_18800 [Desulfoluna limicola]|uniref:Uncharacterized protein n=1 Tax=Desulfoluna limicola TaxID=2810562 RepID=A0ABM7PF73_9BACT|nr:hypothetical protein DSLASN_18800 [Desulfoluna limicola]